MLFRIFFVRLFTSEDQNTYYKIFEMYTKMTALFSLSLRVSANSLAHTCLHKTQYCFAKKPSNWCETFNLFTSAPLHRLSWNHHDSFQCHPLMSRPLLHQLLSKHLGKHFYSNEDNELHLQVTNIIIWIFLLEKSQPCS